MPTGSRKQGVYQKLIYRLDEIKGQIRTGEVLTANRNIDLLADYLKAKEKEKADLKAKKKELTAFKKKKKAKA